MVSALVYPSEAVVDLLQITLMSSLAVEQSRTAQTSVQKHSADDVCKQALATLCQEEDAIDLVKIGKEMTWKLFRSPPPFCFM